jgi:hypothetical protein
MPCWVCLYCWKPVLPPFDARVHVKQFTAPDETTISHRQCWMEAEASLGRIHKQERRSGKDRRQVESLDY